MPKEIPQIDNREVIKTITGLKVTIDVAYTNKEAIETLTFSNKKAPELDITAIEPTDEKRLEVLAALGEKHKVLVNRTIPVFIRLKDRWEQYLGDQEKQKNVQDPLDQLRALEAQRDTVLRHIKDGRLPESEIANIDAIVTNKQQELEAQGLLPIEEEAKKDTREFTTLHYDYFGRRKEIALPETLNPIDYELLKILTRRSDSFSRSEDAKKLIQAALNTTDDISISQSVRRLRILLGDNLQNPKYIDETGAKRGISYRLRGYGQLRKNRERELAIPRVPQPIPPLEPKPLPPVLPEVPSRNNIRRYKRFVIETLAAVDDKYPNEMIPLDDLPDNLRKRAHSAQKKNLVTFVKEGTKTFLPLDQYIFVRYLEHQNAIRKEHEPIRFNRESSTFTFQYLLSHRELLEEE